MIETKVKILAYSDAKVLREKVNDFIKDKDVVDIKFSSLCIPTMVKNGIPTNMVINDRVLIIYKEYKKK